MTLKLQMSVHQNSTLRASHRVGKYIELYLDSTHYLYKSRRKGQTLTEKWSKDLNRQLTKEVVQMPINI